jgi:hypothetical protein
MTKPYLSMAGSYDCIAPYTTNQLPTYDSSGSPCKYLVEVTGASHCQWGVSNAECGLGETASGCASPPLSQAAQINTGLSYIEPYLDYYLKGQTNALVSFDSVYTADAADVRTHSCAGSTLGISDVSALHTSLYPNPAKGTLYLQSDKNIEALRVLDYTGQAVMQKSIKAATTDVDISALSAGIYVVEVTTIDGERSALKFSKE